MPRPEEVNRHNFRVDNIIYDDGEFSIVWGQWEDSTMHLAMRWNSEGNNLGFPSQGQFPTWFLLPQNLTMPTEPLAKLQFDLESEAHGL